MFVCLFWLAVYYTIVVVVTLRREEAVGSLLFLRGVSFGIFLSAARSPIFHPIRMSALKPGVWGVLLPLGMFTSIIGVIIIHGVTFNKFPSPRQLD